MRNKNSVYCRAFTLPLNEFGVPQFSKSWALSNRWSQLLSCELGGEAAGLNAETGGKHERISPVTWNRHRGRQRETQHRFLMLVSLHLTLLLTTTMLHTLLRAAVPPGLQAASTSPVP